MSKNTTKYGIVGFSSTQFDKDLAYQLLHELFTILKKEHAKEEIEIVSGYTNSGIPKIAYELADKFGFTTVGYSAEQALEAKCGVYPVKKVILKGKKFGDESVDFVTYIDRLIRIGGGSQSRKETALFKELNVDQPLHLLVKEFELE